MDVLNRYNNKILARQYDLSEQGSNNDDIEFYLKLLKKYKKSLELGCGTGRITIPLNKAGIDIEGIDFAKEMIKIAKDKSKKLKLKINFKVGDALSFKGNKKYDAIIFTYNSLVMIPQNKIPLLIKNIKNNLKDGGIFAFDIAIPNINYNKLSLVSEKDWSEPIFIKDLNIYLRRKILTKISKDRSKTQIIYTWEIIDKNKKVKLLKTKMSFLKKDTNWYINIFKKYDFVLEKKKIINKNKQSMDHAFFVFKK